MDDFWGAERPKKSSKALVFRGQCVSPDVAEALLDRVGLAFSSHAAVISAFGQQFAKTGQLPAEFHRYLIDAQAQRTRADYDLRPNLTRSDAETLVSQAQALIVAGSE